MDDLQSALQSLLDDPDELQQLAQTAASMLGGADSAPQEEPEFPDLKTIMKRFKNGSQSETKQLVDALAPFLTPQRRARLERAARVASLSSLAELALGSDDGNG